MFILVGLGRKTAVLPANSTLISDAAVCSTAALKRVILLLGAVDPRVEQSNVAVCTAGARAQSTNKVTRLEVVPCDFGSDVWEADGGGAWSRRVESHGDEARAVGAVVGALWVCVGGAHGVWDLAIDPELAAGDDLLAADLAVHGGAATATTACPRDHAGGARFHIIVRNVAAIRCFVPEIVAVNGFASSLTGDFNIVTLLVCRNNFVTG
jgi:hypothetical protein